MKAIYLWAVILIFAGTAYAQKWENSPANWKNSEANWENSPANWENSPANWKNSPANWDSDRMVYDEDGDAVGYRVPKKSGGANYFSLDGERIGYEADEDE